MGVVAGHRDVFGRRAAVGQQVLPLVVAVLGERRIERLVGPGQARFHLRHVGDANLEGLGDLFLAGARQRAVGRFVDARTQPAQVEEQRLLGGGRSGADDRPIAQDEILHLRADPPRGIGREAHFARRLETGGGLHEAKIAFLDQVADRQPVMAEPRRGRDHEARIGRYQLMERGLVAALAPAAGELEFVVALQQRGAHRIADEGHVGPLGVGVVDMSHGNT